MSNIRNFSIIAHIDHGKSTLADRLIQWTGMVEERQFRDQILDTMDIERERGITIKSNTISLPYTADDGGEYELNLIDTPGHVDFSYEVSRALASCEGVLLLVDASQGVEAQTVANLYLAMEHDLTIIPVINKIDLPSADIGGSRSRSNASWAWIRTTSSCVPPRKASASTRSWRPSSPGSRRPKAAPTQPLSGPHLRRPLRLLPGDRGLLPGSSTDAVKPGDIIRLMYNGTTHKVEETGVFRLTREPRKELSAGMVGYLIAGIKTVSDTRIGDTVTLEANPAAGPLPGFKEVKPVVFASIYPVGNDDYQDLADALEKYKLNDASLVYQKDSSAALGQGFRCGFLGLLHLEIVQERLEREYNQSIIMTVPGVRYRFTLMDGKTITVDNPHALPRPQQHQARGGALYPDLHPHPRALRGRGHEALPGAPGRQFPLQLPLAGPGGNQLRHAPGRSHHRLLRPPQDHHPGLRLL